MPNLDMLFQSFINFLSVVLSEISQMLTQFSNSESMHSVLAQVTNQTNWESILAQFSDSSNWQNFLFYFPLGFVGLWRWGVWVFKELVATGYHPSKKPYQSNVSIVAPVYNEDPETFLTALKSWQANNPEEIIAVIDQADKTNITAFKKYQTKNSNTFLVITDIPGKREALAEGIIRAKSEIIALVDSDTIWEKNVIRNALSPFNDPKVGGVATRQNVLKTKTFTQKIFDIQLDNRYFDEMPFLAAGGGALICLSGRTAFYRASAIKPLVDDLVNETFWGKKVVSGDDKRLTYLILKNGWKTAYQNTARVYTPGFEKFSSYLKQRLRWNRNSLRSDMRALLEGWVWKHKTLAFFQIDKVIQTFTVLISPIFFTIALVQKEFLIAFFILTWWLVSRTVKIYPHLRRKPGDIVILPLYIPYTFLNAIVKIYSLFTLNTQGWITRWDTTRLPKIRFIKAIPAYAATLVVFLFISALVFGYRDIVARIAPATEQNLEAQMQAAGLIQKEEPSTLQEGTIGSKADLNPEKNVVARYVVEEGDTIGSIATKYNTTAEKILTANKRFLPNWGRIQAGLVLSIPQEENLVFEDDSKKPLNYLQQSTPGLVVTYLPETKTIEVKGRGNQITLKDISQKLPNKQLREVSPKQWLLDANLTIRNGVILTLDKSEVEWLKISSDKNNYYALTIYNGAIVFQDTKVTSWDQTLSDVDKEYKDGRSNILARDNGRMDMYNSEFAYLGYYPAELKDSPYGVSWRISSGTFGKQIVTGEVKNSKFHDNYFGAYTFGATGMTWLNNEFYDNVQYGWDGHDDTNTTLIEGNKAHDNGNHGIICSKRCFNLVIRNNESYNNRLHGIMLHEDTNNNTVENNTVWGNKDGIAIYQSSNNLVRNNNIFDNRIGIRANLDSKNNVFQNNKITDSREYGVYFYDRADANIVKNNLLINNNLAIYLTTLGNEINTNTLQKNDTGIYLIEAANGNKLLNNKILNNDDYGIYVKTQNKQNFVSKNEFKGNRVNIGSI